MRALYTAFWVVSCLLAAFVVVCQANTPNPITDPGIYVVSQGPPAQAGSQAYSLKYTGNAPTAIPELTATVSWVSPSILHLRIADTPNKRWKVPTVIQVPDLPNPPANPVLCIDIASEGTFGFKVSRCADSSTVLFDATPSSTVEHLIFHDQYISLSANVPETSNLYGLPGHIRPFRIGKDTNLTLYNGGRPR